MRKFASIGILLLMLWMSFNSFVSSSWQKYVFKNSASNINLCFESGDGYEQSHHESNHSETSDNSKETESAEDDFFSSHTQKIFIDVSFYNANYPDTKFYFSAFLEHFVPPPKHFLI